MSVLAIALILLIGVVVPVVLIAWLSRRNVRAHASRRNEMLFWLITGAAAIPLLTAVVVGIVDVFAYEGGAVITASILGFPGSLLAMLAAVPLSHALFDTRSWAELGYFVVIPAYFVSVIAWQVFIVVGIRRLVQHSRRNRRGAVIMNPSTRST